MNWVKQNLEMITAGLLGGLLGAFAMSVVILGIKNWLWTDVAAGYAGALGTICAIVGTYALTLRTERRAARATLRAEVNFLLTVATVVETSGYLCADMFRWAEKDERDEIDPRLNQLHVVLEQEREFLERTGSEWPETLIRGRVREHASAFSAFIEALENWASTHPSSSMEAGHLWDCLADAKEDIQLSSVSVFSQIIAWDSTRQFQNRWRPIAGHIADRAIKP